MNSFDYKSFIDAIWFERRDIVSDGYDKALNHIKGIIPEMQIRGYKSGSEAWTWIIPEKWSVSKAFIKGGGGVLLDLEEHPLHVMSYSIPISRKVSKEELFKNLYSRQDQPDLIPFEFSYYQKKWGFCIEHKRLSNFIYDEYEVCIDSKFSPGELKVGEIFIPGTSEKEVVIMAHLCHPYMVNDGLTGVAVLLKLAQHFLNRDKNNYSYRFLILPETIGSIAYLSHNEHLIGKMEFGMFLEMLGNDDKFSLQKSKQGSSLIDRASELCLKNSGHDFRIGEFCEVIVNDEKVLNGPGINVPSISISRSKYWGRGECPFPEWHTSCDTPDIINIEKLKDAEILVKNILEMIEENYYPKVKVRGPIFLSRFDLWVDWRLNRELNLKQEEVFDYLHHNGKSVIDIAYELDIPFLMLKDWLDKFHKHDLIKKNLHSD